jgi:hypothetical protein
MRVTLERTTVASMTTCRVSDDFGHPGQLLRLAFPRFEDAMQVLEIGYYGFARRSGNPYYAFSTK